MSNLGSKRCSCCGVTFSYSADLYGSKSEAPDMCFMCSKRGGLCLHNLWERHVPGEPLLFHSSRPGEHAGPPTECPICIEARENAEWGRRVMKLNPVGTWPVGGSKVPERET